MILFLLILFFMTLTIIGFLESIRVNKVKAVFVIPMVITILLLTVGIILKNRPSIKDPIRISKYEIASIDIKQFSGGLVSFFDDDNNINKARIRFEDIKILENTESSYIQFKLYKHEKSNLWHVSEEKLKKYTLFITKEDYKKVVNSK